MSAIPRAFTLLGQGQGGTYKFADGTAAAPSVSFLSETNTGIYRVSANIIGATIGGNAIARIGIANAGIYLQGPTASSGYLNIPNTGTVSLIAAGTNQNITLTPSGTGAVLVGANAETNANVGLPNGGIIAFRNAANSGRGGYIYYDNSNNLYFATSDTQRLILKNGGNLLLNTGGTDSGALLQVGTDTTTTAGGAVFGTELFLYRRGSGSLALSRPGASYVGLRLIENSGGAVDFDVTSNNLTVTASNGSITLKTQSTTALTLDSSQNAIFAANVYLPATNSFFWTNRSRMQSPSDGVLALTNNAGTDFTRLQFGGTTASFPALKRTTTYLSCVLADDSGDAPLAAAYHVSRAVAGNFGAGTICYGGTTASTVGAAGGASALPATPLGYIICNVAGTQVKVPYYNN